MAPQGRIRAGRFKSGGEGFHQTIEHVRDVLHVNVHWLKFEPQMQFRIIIKRCAGVAPQAMAKGPIQQIAEGDVIKIELVCDGVVETDIIIVNGAVPNRTKTECDHTATPPPDKVAKSSGRQAWRFNKVFTGENFEAHVALLRHR